ncbi:NUDIX hydrolase [Novosphingobium sp.]|uniref:NUDIX hydrolase n=1 Tax=Novosphingobium sp. TaxID=1874826 RepID=UPI003D13B5C2
MLLVTSRGTGRWVVPKGNVNKHEAPHMAAAREALEEAGVIGAVSPTALGIYFYDKELASGTVIRAEVRLFPMAVTDELADWPEADQRTRRWFSLAEAAAAVDEADLGALIRSFRAPDVRPPVLTIHAPRSSRSS